MTKYPRWLIGFHKRVKSIIIPSKINYFGFQLWIDSTDSHRLINQKILRKDIQQMLKNIKKGDIVIDVGVNLGFTTLLLSRAVGEKGKVYAYEPEKEAYDLLIKNLKENNINNVIPIRTAIGNKAGITTLYKHLINFGGNSLTRFDNTIPQKVSITSIDKEHLFQRIDAMKIDVEGHESEVIFGAQGTIALNPQMMIFIEQWDSSPTKHIQYLIDQGFNKNTIRNIGEEWSDLMFKKKDQKPILKTKDI